MRIVEVIWDDAWASSDEVTVAGAALAKPERTHTVAYLVAENDDGVVLAADTYVSNPDVGRIVNFIPWAMVVEYWELVNP